MITATVCCAGGGGVVVANALAQLMANATETLPSSQSHL